jgi:hypothetical protein
LLGSACSNAEPNHSGCSPAHRIEQPALANPCLTEDQDDLTASGAEI